MDEQEAKKRVLVVDDDPVFRELLMIGLTSGGYDVLLAENGIDGKALVTQENLDLVIVDMLMPLMDGLRFIQWLRGERESATPVLVLTSVDNRDLSVEAMVAGATDVLAKPVSLPALLDRVESVLSKGVSARP